MEENSYIEHLTTRRARLSSESGTPVDIEFTNAQKTSAVKSNLFCSDLSSNPSRHALILDLDMPIEVLKSSSGNNHVIIPKSLSFDDMMEILEVLRKHGIVQPKWVESAKLHGYAALRMPGILKSNLEDDRGLDEHGNIESEQAYLDALDKANNKNTTEEENW